MTEPSPGRRAAAAAARACGRLVVPPVPSARRPLVLTGALVFLGALGAMLPVPSTGPLAWVITAALLTAAWGLAGTRRAGLAWRVGRVAGVVLTVLATACFLVFAWLGVTMFEWVAPWWLRGLQALVALLVVATALPPRARVRVPAVVLFGLCTSLVRLSGPEDGSIRCDDYLRARAQPGVEVLIPTTLDELACRPGERLSAPRYPRTLWEAPDGLRFVVTSQDRGQIGWGYGGGRPTRPRFTGSFCEAWADPGRSPVCHGSGKADGIMEAPDLDRLFVGQWRYDDPARRGTIWSVTRSAPLRVVGRRDFGLRSAGGFYDPAGDLLGVAFDEGVGVDFLRGADLTERGKVRQRFQGGYIRYDAGHHEGILCSGAGPLEPIEGHGYLSIAYRGEPFATRLLGETTVYPWAWGAIVWGCDWDPDRRVVWIAVANLGLVLPLDYDTGRLAGGVVARSATGVRVVTYDQPRQRLYLATWASGEVTAVSLADGRTLRRWFVGRWVRDLVLSRDNRAIFVTSNLGVVRIRVDF